MIQGVHLRILHLHRRSIPPTSILLSKMDDDESFRRKFQQQWSRCPLLGCALHDSVFVDSHLQFWVAEYPPKSLLFVSGRSWTLSPPHVNSKRGGYSVQTGGFQSCAG